MKKLIFVLLLIPVLMDLQAQDYGLYWKYKDYDGAIAFAVPRWAIHAGSWFVEEKADRKLVRKVRKVRVLVFEDQDNPVRDRDIKRFYKKARRKNLEEMLTVRSGKTRVAVWAKERNDAIRKIVVLVREPETFALISLRGKIPYDEIGRLLERIPKDKKGKDSPEEPLLPENVRAVIRM